MHPSPTFQQENDDYLLSTNMSEIPYPFIENHFSKSKKVELIEHHFEQIMLALGLDLNDDSLAKTPHRYAKMLVHELFQGLNQENFPEIATQTNKFNYNEMLVESQISIKSVCEHHFVPILGYCHIAYIPREKVVGLSKLNRIAQHFARRPQVQERMTKQIGACLAQVLGTPDVAVVVDALHLCIRMRGIQDQQALTRTSDLGGVFATDPIRSEFFHSIPKLSEVKL